MILGFADKTTEDIFNGVDSKAARRLPTSVRKIAVRKLDMLNAATSLGDLRSPPGNQLESLKGDLKGYHSIRINDQYRIVFKWQEGNVQDVLITDYH